MLGRPEMVVPVFMKVWAGSWLIASVSIERTMQISSATLAEVREERQISWPDLPNFLNACCGAEALQLLALELRDRLALGERLGHRLAVHLGQLRLVVEGLQVRRPAGHGQEDDPLGLRARSAADRRRRASGAVVECPVRPRRRGSVTTVHERGQRQGAETARGLAQEWRVVGGAGVEFMVDLVGSWLELAQ